MERWIDAACGAGLIAISPDEYRTLRLTPLGRDVMTGPGRGRGDGGSRIEGQGFLETVQEPIARRAGMSPGVAPRPPTAAPEAPPVPEVVAALRAWRLDEARRKAIAPFIILHDRTVTAIAAALPRSIDELHDVPGIGPAKLAEYGAAIVAVVASAAHPRGE